MAVDPGRFDSLVTIQDATETRDGIEVVKTWNTVAQRWAEITPAGRARDINRERFEAFQVAQNIQTVITLREDLPGLDTKHRILHDGRIFYIRGISGESRRITHHGQICACTEDAP